MEIFAQFFFFFFFFFSVLDKNMSSLQLQIVDFIAKGLKCDETSLMKVLVKILSTDLEYQLSKLKQEGKAT